MMLYQFTFIETEGELVFLAGERRHIFCYNRKRKISTGKGIGRISSESGWTGKTPEREVSGVFPIL